MTGSDSALEGKSGAAAAPTPSAAPGATLSVVGSEQLESRNAELTRLNDDLNNFLACSPVPMIALDVDLRVRRLTTSAAKLLNVLPGDVGRPFGDLEPPIEIPDLEKLVAEVIDTAQVHERELLDRRGRHYLLRIHPYRTSDNRIDGAVLVFDSEQTAEQAMRLRQKAALINLSSDAIIARDRNNVITFWNHGAELMYGWTAAEAIGRVSHELLKTGSPEDATDIDSLLRAQDRWQGELTHARRDGTRILVESRHVVHRAENGEVLAILEINRDITERKRMLEELAEADQRKTDFLAVLAHELRNPLTPIRNGLEVLQMIGSRSSEAAQTREMINRNVGTMTRLIDDLMDVSRITHGNIELRREPVDAAAALRNRVADLRRLPEAAGRRLDARLPAQPVYVDADPVRFDQIVENLLHNAVRYTDEGGRIDVSLARENSEAVLRVRDSGVGIAPEDLPQIWDPFTQARTPMGRKRSGLGIGLTLVRKLVELHGGSIAAASEGLGRGSEFVVRLPALAGEPAKRGAPAARDEPQSLSRHRVLVVDDNADATGSFAALLKLMGNEVATAEDGPAALRLATEFRPDLVLLDIGLPGMDGYEVARRLRSDAANGHTLIVAVSGYGTKEDQARAAEAGFDAHFVKPMDIAELQSFVDSRTRA